MTHATDLGKVVQRLQLERGEVAFYIYTNKSEMIDNLKECFNQTNKAIHNMDTWTEIKIPAISNDTDEEREVLLNKSSFILRLEEFRNKIIMEENREHNVFEVCVVCASLSMDRKISKPSLSLSIYAIIYIPPLTDYK